MTLYFTNLRRHFVIQLDCHREMAAGHIFVELNVESSIQMKLGHRHRDLRPWAAILKNFTPL